MKQTLFDALTQFLEIAWRRRVLLLLPLLAAIPLGFAASRLLPQAYTARALLALQETGNDNPLAQTNTPNERDIKDRAPGLQALIKSDRVLANALRDVLGDRMPSDPRAVALAVRDLDSRLSFEMIGNNFLELQLKSGDRRGLGRQLEAITSRFLETLVSPDQDALSATQLVLERHRETVTTAEKALLLFKTQLGERTLAAMDANGEQLKAREASLQSQTADLAAIDEDIARFKSALGGAAAPENAGRRDAEIRAATAAAEAAETKRGAQALADAQSARARIQQLTQLQALETRGAIARRDLEQAKAALSAQATAGADARSPAGQLRRLQKELDDARAEFETYSARFPTAMSSRTLQVLSAPERIRVIDAPKDPEFPTTPRLKIFIATVLAGLAVAVALASGAELFDQHLRHPAEFEAAAGVPVIARLPRARPAAKSGDADTAPSEALGDGPPDTTTQTAAVARPGSASPPIPDLPATVTRSTFGRRQSAA